MVDDHAKKLDDDRRAATTAEAIRINWFFGLSSGLVSKITAAGEAGRQLNR